MKVAILTREFPPDVYGGAGVHVDFLVRELRRLIDVDVHCMGEPRNGATAHSEDDPRIPNANAALRILSTDLTMTAAVGEADLVHSHTWYANMAGHWAKLLYDVPHVVTAHSLEPRRPWKAEQLGGGYRLSSWAERTAYEAADAVVAVSRGMRDRRTGVLSVDRPGQGARDLERDRRGLLPAGSVDARARAARRRPEPSVRDVRRPDHPAEGRAAPAPRGAASGPVGAARAAGRRGRHGRAEGGDRRADRRPEAGPRRRVRGLRDAAARGGPAGADARAGVLLPVDLRAARHRQPGGDGVRDRGRGERGRRHSGGRRRRRDRHPGPVRRERPGHLRTRSRGRDQRPGRRSCSRPTRWARPGRERAVSEFGWDAVAQRTVELYNSLLG